MTIATLNDTELFYQVVGNGLLCLVMHGGLGLDHTYPQIRLGDGAKAAALKSSPEYEGYRHIDVER